MVQKDKKDGPKVQNYESSKHVHYTGSRTSSSLHDIDHLPLLAPLSQDGRAQVAVLALGAVHEGGAGALSLLVPPRAGAGAGHQGGLAVGGQAAGGPRAGGDQLGVEGEGGLLGRDDGVDELEGRIMLDGQDGREEEEEEEGGHVPCS